MTLTLPLLYALTGFGLFAIGLHALITRSHLLRKLLALNIMGSGVFLVLAGLGRRGGNAPDPVPQAMVLTGIVVAVAATALGLALLLRLQHADGRAHLSDEGGE